MNNNKSNTKLRKFLSLVLRHRPELIGLKLSENGWVDTVDLIAKTNTFGKEINIKTLQTIVDTDNKQRYSFNEDKSKIRANQGHSITVDLGYKPKTPPDILYHGTAKKYISSIFNSGLNKRERHHVHLSVDYATAKTVGKRHGKPVVLIVDAKKMHNNGCKFYESANKVWLTDYIPPVYLSIKEIE